MLGHTNIKTTDLRQRDFGRHAGQDSTGWPASRKNMQPRTIEKKNRSGGVHSYRPLCALWKFGRIPPGAQGRSELADICSLSLAAPASAGYDNGNVSYHSKPRCLPRLLQKA